MEKILLNENVESKVQVMQRIEALYFFVYELAECFHANENTLSKIQTGILDNQILEKIFLEYDSATKENIGCIVISIDWEKHFLIAKTDKGKFIEIDMSKSVVDNIVDWRQIAQKHIDELMKQFNVIRVRGVYTFREEIRTDEDQYKKAQKIMHTTACLEERQKNIDINFQEKMIETYPGTRSDTASNIKKRSFSCGIMEEVNLDMYYRRK